MELKGVRFLEEKLSPNLTVSTVVIETENGGKDNGKTQGNIHHHRGGRYG